MIVAHLAVGRGDLHGLATNRSRAFRAQASLHLARIVFPIAASGTWKK